MRRKATHLHKSPHTPGLLMRKISKSQPSFRKRNTISFLEIASCCQCFRSLDSYKYTAIGSVGYLALLTWLAFKHYNSWTDPFRKRATSLYVTSTYKARYLPKNSSQIKTLHSQRACSRPQFPRSTRGTQGTMTPLLATKNGLQSSQVELEQTMLEWFCI